MIARRVPLSRTECTGTTRKQGGSIRLRTTWLPCCRSIKNPAFNTAEIQALPEMEGSLLRPPQVRLERDLQAPAGRLPVASRGTDRWLRVCCSAPLLWLRLATGNPEGLGTRQPRSRHRPDRAGLGAVCSPFQLINTARIFLRACFPNSTRHGLTSMVLSHTDRSAWPT